MNINKSVNNDEKVKSLVDEYNQWIEAVKWLRGHVKTFHVYVKKTIIPFCIQNLWRKAKELIMSRDLFTCSTFLSPSMTS